MDGNLIYEKTADGEAAVNQRTRLVQRNLRTVLIMVDGASPVAALCEQVGNVALVEDALQQLEADGFIRLVVPAANDEPGDERRSSVSSADEGVPAFSAEPLAPAEPNPFAASDTAMPRVFVDDPDDEPATAAYLPPVEVNALAAAFPATKRRRWGWPALVGVGTAVLLLGVLLAVFFYPVDRFRAELARQLATAFRVTVTDGAVSLSVLPRPTVVARGIVLSRDGQPAGRIDEVRAALAWSSLFGSPPRVETAVLRGLRVDAAALVPAPGGASGDAALAALGLRRITLEDLALSIGNQTWTGLRGDIELRAEGGFDRASVQDATGQWSADLTPGAAGLELALAAGPIADFPRPGTVIERFRARGLVAGARYDIRELDLRTLGGIVEGHATLAWQGGWALSADLQFKRLDLGGLVSALGSPLRLEGHVDGDAKFSAAAAELAGLAGSTRGEGRVAGEQGRILGVDFADAVRRGGRSASRGGETRFDRFEARARWQGTQVDLSPFELQAGLMRARGQIMIDGGALAGRTQVSIGGSGASVSAALKLIGTTQDPGLVAQ